MSAPTSAMTTPSTPYGREFFADIRASAHDAGRVVLPWVFELLQPASVVDVGCGTAGWGAAARSLGVEDIVGLDGDYVDRSQLQIPADRFVPTDLSRPFSLGRRFDLAICTEVAEHLPASRADSFVQDLTSHAAAIVFSAAVPWQGGTHHVNEQWPSYWAAKFGRRGFVSFDCLRAPWWNQDDLAWWYRQNLFLAVDERLLRSRPDVAARLDAFPREVLPLVHPEAWLMRRAAETRLRNAPRALLRLLLDSIRRHLTARDSSRQGLAHELPDSGAA